MARPSFASTAGGRSPQTAHDPVPMLAEHVLLPFAGPIREADERLAARAVAAVGPAVALVPDVWLGADPAARRADLAAFLETRLASPRVFVEEAEHARA